MRNALFLSLLLIVSVSYSQFKNVPEDTTVTVTPDVTTGIVWFDAHEKVVDTVQITRILGKIAFTQAVNTSNGSIGIDSLPRSCYYISFIIGNKRLTQKLFFM